MLRSSFILLILIKFILFDTYDDSINGEGLCYYYKYIRQYTMLLCRLLLLLPVVQYTSIYLYSERLLNVDDADADADADTFHVYC